MHQRWKLLALRVAAIYALVAGLWIAFSDSVAALLFRSLGAYETASMVKGFAFVLVTSLLLFDMLRRIFRTEFEARSKAEATAQQLQELRTIADHSGELLYKHDLNHRFTYANPQYRVLLGYEPEQINAEWTRLLTENPVNQQAIASTQRAIQTGQRQPPYLVEIRKRDQSPVLLEVDESPFKNASGEVVAMVGAARDVTSREQAERKLRESERRFRQLAENISEVFWMADLELKRIEYVSPAYETIWGRSCASLYETPASWAEAIHPEDRVAAWEALKQDRGAREVNIEYRIVRPDGTIRWILDRAFPLRNESGAPVGLVGIARDITKRKTTEAALKESEHLYRAIFEAANDGFLILEQGRCSDCNQRAAEIYGRNRSTLMGASPLDFSPEQQPDGRSSLEKVEEVVTQAEGGTPQFFQWQHCRQDGSLFMVEVSLRRLDMESRVLLLAVVRDITKRIQSEEALRESEGKLRALYTSMNEGLAVHEIVQDASGQAVDYRILDVNPAFELITGLKREEVVGELATKAYSTGVAPYLDIYQQVASSGQSTSFETYFPPIDKHFTVSVFSPRAGQFATVFADISKRKEAEQQIVLLNQVYALVSRVNEAIVRASDRNTLFQETCRIVVEQGQFEMAWIGLLDKATNGVRPAAWAGKEEGYLTGIHITSSPLPHGKGPTGTAVREGRVVVCADIVNDPAMAPWRDAALARGYRSMIALPLKTGSAVTGALSVYSHLPNFFTAMLTESLIEVAADLTFALDLFERNRQRELEQQQLRLQHSALEAAANAIAITDRRGLIQWVNDAFVRLTGYDRQEAIGRNPRLLKSGVQDTEFYRELWQTVLAGSVWQGELTNRRKDGGNYQEEMTITPVRSESGEITHFVAIKQDITERRRLEQQFLRAQRMQSIGLLAGGVAHDLNNVLAPVLMALPLLRQEMNPDQRNHVIDTLEQSVKRGANIVQQVLTFARGIEVQRVLVQLRHLTREVTRIAEETFPRDIRIRTAVPANLWPLLGDPTQIHQVLLNLAVNARDAMPGGGELAFTARNIELFEGKTSLDFEIPPGRYVSVSVSDTGTGIAPEVLERIFEPFFTTKPAGKGTGLGLSTVLGIVKSHGGLVEVQSRMDSGSTFTIFLPAAPPETAAENFSERPALPQGRGETVLIVDDEAGILQITRSTLEANGYKVITARDGTQALARLYENSDTIQAVLTDIMMPVMDGLALTRTLRKQYPMLPVIAATGLMNPPNEEDRAAQLRELGVRYFLRKPFQAEELLIMLHETLTRQPG